MYEGAVQDLIDELGRLPGVGPKSAQRIAFHLLAADPVDVRRLVDSLTEVKARVQFCTVCGNVSQEELCRVCRDPRRSLESICVVEEPKDVVAIERTREFRGRYHVLGGAINPMDNVGPDDLRIAQLMTRLADGTVTEVIIATDPNVEGEATATYLARLLVPMGLRVTRLASGLPVGGDLEYADEVTLGRAFEGRRQISAEIPSIPTPKGSPFEAADVAADVPTDLRDVARAVSTEARSFLSTVTEVAAGANPEAAIPLLLLAVSDVLASGSRLGAMVDVVPPARFEPDVGPDDDLDPLRAALENVLEGIDDYAEVVDPILGSDVVTSTMSSDLVLIAGALTQGMRHYEAGQILEALWWWQYSYLSNWGERGSSVLRVLQAVLAHLRLDVDDEVAAEAEFQALHP